MSDCDGCKWRGFEKVCQQCKDRATVSTPNVERSVKHEPVGKGEDNKVHKAFRVSFHHRTNRLTDSDGRSIKAALDGLVLGGILPDDSPKFLPKIPGQTQEKKAGKEETVITITESPMR